MELSNLKQILLSYNVLLDNEYLDAYVNLVVSNLGNSSGPGIQKHHIIPVKYYAHGRKLTRTQAVKLADSDKNNFCINISRELHAVAHCYLALASKECWFTALNLAAIGLLGYDNSDPKLLLNQIKTNSMPKAKRCWIHRGDQNKNINISYLPAYLESGWSLKSNNRHKQKKQAKTEKSIWMHLQADKQKVQISQILDYLKLGYLPGMSDDSNRQYCYINNSVEIKKVSIDSLRFYLESGWKYGKIDKK